MAMASDDIIFAERLERRPLHPLFVSFPITCLVAALLTDITYWATAEMVWADFSAWLISAGVVLGWIALIFGVVDLSTGRFNGVPHAAIYIGGQLLALILATLNMFVHTRDAWTSVVPWGLTLSALTFIILLVTTWIGWAAIYRRESIVGRRVLEA